MINPDYMMSTVLQLAPLTTKIHEYHFYFPSAGEFTCYPAAVTKDGHLVANSAIERKITVHKVLPKKELVTMKDILTGGKQEDILNFMRTQNILKSDVFKFRDIYGLLFDKNFYENVCKILEERGIYEQVVYSFSVYHYDVPRLRKYINQHFEDSRITVRDLDIYYMNTELIKFEDYSYKEYYPLRNPRVHDIGEYKHNITNRDFLNTYITFLKYLLDKGTIGSREWLYLSIYFLLQDRVDDTLKIFKKIDRAQLNSKCLLIQYDYLTAYLDLFVDETFAKAKEICGEYLTYPIYSWRNRFIELANQIAEVEGQAEIMAVNDEIQNKKEVAKQVIFEASIEEGKIKIKAQNIKSFTMAYHEVDPEVSFSQDQFGDKNYNSIASVKPILVTEHSVKQPGELDIIVLSIPDSLKEKNLNIIVKAPGESVKNLQHYPSSMNASIFESAGMIKLTDKSNQPLSKVYVKCFLKLSSGAVVFYRDGYTDLRGTFDYTGSINSSATSISILISSPQGGSLIYKVNPPKGKKVEEGVVLEVKGQELADRVKHLTENIDFDDINFGGTEEMKAGKKGLEMKRNKYWK